MNAQGTDRAHKIPSGGLINAVLGPVLDFTILRFGLGLEVDDAPKLWAPKVKRLLGYWLPTSRHTGAASAVAFAHSLLGYPVIGAALDYEPVGEQPPPSASQVAEFRTTFKALRPDLPLGFYGNRNDVARLAGPFDWSWIAADPQEVPWDMHQTVSGGVDRDEWRSDLADFEAFFGGGEETMTKDQNGALAFMFGLKESAQGDPEPDAFDGGDTGNYVPAAKAGWAYGEAEKAHRSQAGGGDGHKHGQDVTVAGPIE